jgi:hypothetical protein
MRPNHGRRLALAILLAAAAALSYACTNLVNTATGGTGGNVNGPSGVGSSPSPSPGTGALPAGAFVRVGFYGISCPQGTTAPPNGLRELPLACRGFMTATPKYSDGSDIPATVHGPNCSWELTSGASFVNLQTTGEPFNRDATCAAAGPWAVKAIVLNVSGEAGFTCVASASRSTVGDFWSLLELEGLEHERANGRDYYFATWATAEQRAGAKARDHEAMVRAHRGSGADVSASNCNNCHPPHDPDGPPGLAGGER